MKSIELIPEEIDIAKALATKRHEACQASGVKDKQKGDQDPIEIHFTGFCGELACAKFLNVYADYSTHIRKGGWDLIGKNGKKIDVKTSKNINGKLYIEISKKPDAVDFYIFCTKEDSLVNIVGYIASKDAICESNIGDVGHGLSYVIPQNRLIPI